MRKAEVCEKHELARGSHVAGQVPSPPGIRIARRLLPDDPHAAAKRCLQFLLHVVVVGSQEDRAEAKLLQRSIDLWNIRFHWQQSSLATLVAVTYVNAHIFA